MVQDQNGVRGGLFVDRAEALRYVRLENGNQPGAVVAVSGVLELDLTGKPTTAARFADNTRANAGWPDCRSQAGQFTQSN